MNYSVSNFLTREKNKLVNHSFISKKALRDFVFLWKTVDEESVIVNAGALKQEHLLFMQNPYNSVIFCIFIHFKNGWYLNYTVALILLHYPGMVFSC